MPSLTVTTSLGRDFMRKTNITYNPKTGSVEPLLDKTTYYAWMRSLVVCAGLSRLAYSPTDVFCRGLELVDCTPDVINDAVSVLEYNLFSMVAERKVSDEQTYNSLAMSQTPAYQALYEPIDASSKQEVGAFFPGCGCYIIRRDTHLYVVFKGSSAIKDFINDLRTTVQTAIKQMPHCTDALDAATTGVGFWDHMKSEAQSIADTVSRLCRTSPTPTRIVVTGHSLGGAQATLMSLILAKAPEITVPVACVTFGAPFVFSATARNYYNEQLKSGRLTLDRVTGFDKGLKKFVGVMPGSGADIITSLGSPLVHPGYNVLNTEFYAASRTGRAFHIDEVSKVYIGEGSKGFFSKLMGSGVNELPNDIDFWKGFKLLEEQRMYTTAKEFKGGDSKRRMSSTFLALLYPDALYPTGQGMSPEATAQAQVPDPELSKGLVAASASVPVEDEPASPPAGLATRKQRGGFALSQAGADYKIETMGFAPNRLNFQCNKRTSLNFCHASYMNIGFMGAMRLFPVVRIGSIPARRKEPKVLMALYFCPGSVRKVVSGLRDPVAAPAAGPTSGPAAFAGGRRSTRRRRNSRRQTRKVARGE